MSIDTPLEDTFIEHNGHTIRGHRKVLCLRLLKRRPTTGWTAKEISAETGLHHGLISGPLSMLHAFGIVALLRKKREGYKVYVLAENVNGRETVRRKHTRGA